MVENSEIYVRLIDGTEVEVAVNSLEIEKGVFLITENKYWDDEDHTAVWQFFIGDKVTVKREGKHLKADRLIEYSKSIPGRELRDLVFLITGSMGNIKPIDLGKKEKFLAALCHENSIPQKEHPIVKRWLSENCPSL